MVVIAETLRSLLSPDQVFEGASLSEVWQQSARAAGVEVSSVCRVAPRSEAELSAVVKVCSQNRWRVLPCGSGSKLGWGNSPDPIDVVVSLAHLNRVVEHWVEDFTVRAEAGLGFAALQQQLAQHRQFVALDPLYRDRATLGGLVATADAGSLRQRYGGVRDMLIGVQFVRYDGEIVKAGGRVVKNVAGYDLMKLMTGAYGTLGILTQLTLRLYPQPEHSQTIAVTGHGDAIQKTALEARLSGLTPVALDILAGSFPLLPDSSPNSAPDSSPASPPGSPLDLAPGHCPPTSVSLIAQFQGISAGVEEQVSRLCTLAHAAGAQTQTVDDSLWSAISTALIADSTSNVLCKVGMLPTSSADFLQLAETSLPQGWLGRLHNASGVGLLRFEASGQTSGKTAELIAKLRSHCEAHQGYLSVLQAPAEVKQKVDVWGYRGSALGVMQRLKANFDPQDIFNPGRFIRA
ncbi:MAG: FAD-binding oxidoreductase [Cyanobacteria bacterium P01_A01_bin.114]